MKVTGKAKLGIVAVVGFSALAAFFGGPKVKEAATNITNIGLPILLGLVLSAIGVLISTLGNLYNAIMGMASGFSNRERAAYIASVEGFDRSVDEIRDNTLLMLVFLAIGLGAPLVGAIAVSESWWILKPEVMTGAAFVDLVGKCLTAITLAVTVLSMWAIRDTAETMFTIHKYYVEVTKNVVRTAKPSRNIVFKMSDSDEASLDELTD